MRRWLFYSLPGASLDALALLVAWQHSSVGPLPAALLHSAKTNVAVWLSLLSAMSLAHAFYCALSLRKLADAAIASAALAAVAYAFLARFLLANHTITTCLHRRLTATWSFRAAWSIVLAVIGALGGGSSPLPLANAYQGASGALLLLAIFTIMSLPYDQPELIARVMRELRRGEAEAEARDAEVTVRAAEQVRDVLHYADWLTAKFSRWALFGDVYSVLLLAQDRKLLVDDLCDTRERSRRRGDLGDALWETWREECRGAWGRRMHSQSVQGQEIDLTPLLAETHRLLRAGSVADGADGAAEAATPGDVRFRRDSSFVRLLSRNGSELGMRLQAMLQSGIRGARQAAADMAENARSRWEHLLRQAESLRHGPQSEDEVAARLTQPLVSPSERTEEGAGEVGAEDRDGGSGRDAGARTQPDGGWRRSQGRDRAERRRASGPSAPNGAATASGEDGIAAARGDGRGSPDDASPLPSGVLAAQLAAHREASMDLGELGDGRNGASSRVGGLAMEWRGGDKDKWYLLHPHAGEGRPAEGPQQEPSLFHAILRVWGAQVFWLGLMKLANDALSFAGPVLLHQIVWCLENAPRDDAPTADTAAAGDSEPDSDPAYAPLFFPVGSDPLRVGLTYAALLGITSVAKAVLNTRYTYRLGVIQAHTRAALTLAVLRKSLLLPEVDLGPAAGAPQALMSSDAERVSGLFLTLHELCSMPLQIAAGLWLLYTQLRWSFLAGLGVMLVVVPANRWLALAIQRASLRMLAAKERRIGLLQTIILNIKQLKMLGWEGLAGAKVSEHRRREMRELAVRKYLDALCVFFWAAASLLFATCTFTVYALLGYRITSTAVFTSMSLFNVLIHSINALPWVVTGLMEARVSLARLRAFLELPETMGAWADGTQAEKDAACAVGAALGWPDGRVRVDGSGAALREALFPEQHLPEARDAALAHRGSLSVPRQPGRPTGSSTASVTEFDPPPSTLARSATGARSSFAREVPGRDDAAFSRRRVAGFDLRLDVGEGAGVAAGAGAGAGIGPESHWWGGDVGIAPAVVARGASFTWAASLPSASLQNRAGRASHMGDDSMGGLAHTGASVGSAPQAWELRGVDFAAYPGSLVVVSGPTGSGKSSLLLALLGEMRVLEGEVAVRGSVGFVSSDPWLRRGTVRDNITCGRPMDRDLYAMALEGCALDRDLEQFAEGDLTYVGERGITLSGGQKRRLALARALYANSDVFLIDDILGSLDAHVAAWVFERAILRLRSLGKAVVVVAHSMQPRSRADLVLEMAEGRVVNVIRGARNRQATFDFSTGASPPATAPDMSSVLVEGSSPMGGAPMSFADANGAWRFWAGDGLPGAPWLGDRTASPPLGAAQRKAAARNLTKELECLRLRKYPRLREMDVPFLDLNAPPQAKPVGSAKPGSAMGQASAVPTEAASSQPSPANNDDAAAPLPPSRSLGRQQSIYSVSGVVRAPDGSVQSDMRSSTFEDKARQAALKAGYKARLASPSDDAGAGADAGTEAGPTGTGVGANGGGDAGTGTGAEAGADADASREASVSTPVDATPDGRRGDDRTEGLKEAGSMPESVADSTAGTSEVPDTPSRRQCVATAPEPQTTPAAARTPGMATPAELQGPEGGADAPSAASGAVGAGAAVDAPDETPQVGLDRVDRRSSGVSSSGEGAGESSRGRATAAESGAEGAVGGRPFAVEVGGADAVARQEQEVEEEREVGRVRREVVAFYAMAAGPALTLAILAFLVLMQASRNMADLWFSFWVTQEDSHPLRFWLRGVLVLSAANVALTLARSFSFASGALRAAWTVHGTMLRTLLVAPAAFFDRTGAGLVINRFASDMAIIDDQLPFILNILLANAAGLAGSFVVLCMTQPLLLSGLPPLAVAYMTISRFYRAGSREIRRLDAVVRTPLYALFTDVVKGGTDVRALGMQGQFMEEARRAVATTTRAAVTAVMSSQWLAVRLQLLASAVVTVIAVVAVLAHAKYIPESQDEAQSESGLLGLCLTYALPITGTLHAMLTSSAEAETDLVSVERVKQFVAQGAKEEDGETRRVLEVQMRQAMGAQAGTLLEDVIGAAVPADVTLRSLASLVLSRITRLLTLPCRMAWCSLRSVLRACGAGLFDACCCQTQERGALSRTSTLAGMSRTSSHSTVTGAALRIPPPGQRERGWVRRAIRGPGSPTQAPRPPPLAASLPAPNPSHVAFEDVWLRYSPRSPWALAGLSFEVPRGSKLAIIGRTGAGKSSVFGVVLRLYSPERGVVRIMGEDARSIDLTDLRTYVGTVVQSPVVIEGPVRDNLDPEGRFPDAELVEVLKAVQLWDRLAQAALPVDVFEGQSQPAPQGAARQLMRTRTPRPRNAPFLGPRMLPARHDFALPTSMFALNPTDFTGSQQDMDAMRAVLDSTVDLRSLSQGQQQQLGLARVLLRRPRIVLLDESTSGMDPVTAGAMQVMTQRVLSGCTVLQVAHRLGLVMDSDGLLLMDGGRVVESGNPKKLAAEPKSRFAQLVQAARDFNNRTLTY